MKTISPTVPSSTSQFLRRPIILDVTAIKRARHVETDAKFANRS